MEGPPVSLGLRRSGGRPGTESTRPGGVDRVRSKVQSEVPSVDSASGAFEGRLPRSSWGGRGVVRGRTVSSDRTGKRRDRTSTSARVRRGLLTEHDKNLTSSGTSVLSGSTTGCLLGDEEGPGRSVSVWDPNPATHFYLVSGVSSTLQGPIVPGICRVVLDFGECLSTRDWSKESTEVHYKTLCVRGATTRTSGVDAFATSLPSFGRSGLPVHAPFAPKQDLR